jgi:hypothetical protein
MPKIDKIKEQIGWLKVVFGIFMAIEITLIGWLANNYDNPSWDSIKIYMNIVAIIIVSAIIIYVNKVAFRKIADLENL